MSTIDGARHADQTDATDAATPGSSLAIEATGLTKSFGDTRAVDGVDLAVRSGSVYGVLGPNGAGKTTTIRMLATLLSPDGGSARVLGHDIVTQADAVRGLVSLTGQLASVDEDLTGRENLVLLGRLLGLGRAGAKARAGELLDAFGLAEAAGKLVKHYSGGMRRRLDIAASIVVTPQLMFLDEPTTGLDPRSRNQVWDIVRALVAEGTTILLCTQYLDEADQLADGIAVIDRGRVIAEGTPAQLKASVGSGALHVRLLDPQQREQAAQVLARARGGRPSRARPGGPVGPLRRGRPRRRCARRAQPRRRAGGQLLARPAEPRRGLPGADRSDSRPARRGPRPAGGRRSMTTTTHAEGTTETAAVRQALSSTPRPPRPGPLSTALTFGWRGMLKVKHVPEQLLDVTITPVMFVLMFTYLFGGAIAGSTGAYLDYILPGILVMSVLFVTVYSGVALNTDLTKGVVDRFRSLPIWRPAPLVGALLGDSVRYLLSGSVIIVLGVALGYRPGAGAVGVLAALALVVVFAFGLSWVFTTLGLLMRTPNAVMNAGFMAIFPLTFLSNVFIDPRTLPGGLEAFVNVNPISTLATASRGLMEGGANGSDILIVLATAAVLTAVFAPLTTRLYRTRG
jgi:ABC transporter DrrB family efflux protein